MMRTLCLLLGVVALMACEKDDFLKELDNPHILRTDYIDTDALHLAFPSIAGNEDRSKIVVVYRVGTDHISFDGRLVQVESYDKGKTWRNRKVIYQPQDMYDARDPQLIALPDGAVLCRFFERESQNKSKVKSIKSQSSWSEYSFPITFPFPTKQEDFGAARGNMVLVDGSIYAVCYNRWAQTWMARSDDLGETWKSVAWLEPNFFNGKIPYGPINEASLGYVDGKMYVVGRQMRDDGNLLLQLGVSTNMGAKWNWSYLPFKGHAPSLTPYDGGFILTYRNITDRDAGRYTFDVALLKDGEIVKGPFTLFESSSFDIGYGDVLTLDNSFLVCCYQPGAIRSYEIKYSIFK